MNAILSCFTPGGVFVVLLCGLAIAVCVAIIEFWQYNRKHRQLGVNRYHRYDPDNLDNLCGGSMLAMDMGDVSNRETTNQKRLQLMKTQQAEQQPVHSHTQRGCTYSKYVGAGATYRNNIITYGRGMQRRTICAEMTDEFCFALRCMGSRQRPLLKRRCSRCSSLQSLNLAGIGTGSGTRAVVLGRLSNVQGHSNTLPPMLKISIEGNGARGDNHCYKNEFSENECDEPEHSHIVHKKSFTKRCKSSSYLYNTEVSLTS